MYSREIDGRIFTFEASGGLIHASLVMQDHQTNSYWSIMNHTAIKGPLSGKKLNEIPAGLKMEWREWKKRYPATLVLSVDGIEDAAPGYINYFNSPLGFRGIKATDERLSDKEPVFAFEFIGKKYAIPARSAEQGRVIHLDNTVLFFFRPLNAAIYHSTLAFYTNKDRVVYNDGIWETEKKDCFFDITQNSFHGTDQTCPQRLGGLDTFSYIWSLHHPDTEILP